ncbi:MAG: hypothetical protein ABW360_04490, partial [Phenylobacterium sp.]
FKKSESLEIRLSHPAKQAFMARCHAEGLSASEALRGFIEAQVAPRQRRPLRALAIGGLLVAALGAVAAPSLARPAVGAQFEAMDANRDGAVTATEFARLDADHDGRVTFREFTQSDGRTARP